MSTVTDIPSPIVFDQSNGRSAPSVWTLLRAEVTDEMKLIVREPAALFFSVLMPVLFFALFSSMFGAQESSGGGSPAGTLMLATFGAYGVIASTMITPGIGLAESRERGWLEAVKVSPVPVPVTLTAKVLATLPYCLGILTAMTATAAGLGVLDITVGAWLTLVAALLLGSLPFALIGLAVGALASGNATTAILNAIIIPMAVAGGLWFPLSQMPDWVGYLAKFLPTYHLSQIGLAPLTGNGGDGSVVGHVTFMLAFAAIAGVVAAITYRRSTSR